MNKQHILDEIKRTAKANGGVVLGWKRFKDATGIAPADVGRFWARWGDAVTEAGLSANKMTQKLDERFLLRRLAELTRKFGHFPVKGELRLEALHDVTVPNEKTFSSSFGSKPQRVAKLLAFCQSNPEFQDVVPLLASVEAATDEEPSVETKTEERDGWVYMLRSGRYYKIGFSNDVGRRAKEIRTELPEQMNEIHRIRTDDPSGIEAYWHNRFKEKRRNGEWFELNATDVRIFKKRKFM